MLKQLHRALLKNPITRNVHLRTARWIRRGLGIRDPYFDLLSIARQTHPAAILDIGSFVGETIAMLTQGTSLPIHGFEPTPQSFRKLAARYRTNPQVQLHPIALGERDGEIAFFGNQNPQTNSILDNDVGNTQSFPSHTKHIEKFTVPVRALDGWIVEHIPSGNVLIKADVQGAEGQLLQGGKQTFQERVLAFYSEVQLAPMYAGQSDFLEIHRQLLAWGFVMHNIYECHHDSDGRATQTDALWIRENVIRSIRLK